MCTAINNCVGNPDSVCWPTHNPGEKGLRRKHFCYLFPEINKTNQTELTRKRPFIFLFPLSLLGSPLLRKHSQLWEEKKNHLQSKCFPQKHGNELFGSLCTPDAGWDTKEIAAELGQMQLGSAVGCPMGLSPAKMCLDLAPPRCRSLAVGLAPSLSPSQPKTDPGVAGLGPQKAGSVEAWSRGDPTSRCFGWRSQQGLGAEIEQASGALNPSI